MPKKFITKEKRAELEKELETLETGERRRVAKVVEEARRLGDLSENAEYQDARDEQGRIEARIAEIRQTLKIAIIIDDRARNSDRVCVGSKLKVKINGNEPAEISITGSKEANPLGGSVSNESPLGQALLGAKEGDEVVFKTPEGDSKCKIVKLY